MLLGDASNGGRQLGPHVALFGGGLATVAWFAGVCWLSAEIYRRLRRRGDTEGAVIAGVATLLTGVGLASVYALYAVYGLTLILSGCCA